MAAPSRRGEGAVEVDASREAACEELVESSSVELKAGMYGLYILSVSIARLYLSSLWQESFDKTTITFTLC